MLLSGDEIVELAWYRSRQLQNDMFRWNNIAKILDGKHNELFPRELPQVSGPYPNRPAPFIRRSWRQFTNLVGIIPDVYSTPLGDDKKSASTSDKVEKICRGYMDYWGMHRKMRTFAALTSAFGACGIGITPDFHSGWPMLQVEDPRHVLPGPSWTAAGRFRRSPSFIAPNVMLPFELQSDTGGPLSDCIVRKMVTGHQLKQLFGAKVNEFLTDTSVDLHKTFALFQYCDEDHWITVLANNKQILSAGEHGLGWCPWQYYSLFTPGDNTSTSDLEQQIGLEVAFMRILNQKLELNDGVAYPWLLKKGWVEIDAANREIVAGSPDSDASFLTPPATFQVDRDLSIVSDMLRVFNWETETSTGDAQGGPITGRGLGKLDSVREATVQAFFDDYSYYLSKTFATALVMDRTIFPDKEKQLAGRASGEPFMLKYTPGKDIPEEFGRIDVEFGPGLGGYEGHLQMLQDLGADAISQDTVMRKNPFIHSVNDEKRKRMSEKVQSIMIDQALKGETAVPFDWLAQFVQAIEHETDYIKWVAEHPPGQNAATPQTVGPVPPGSLPPAGPGAPGGTGPPPDQQAAPGLADFMAQMGNGQPTPGPAAAPPPVGAAAPGGA